MSNVTYTCPAGVDPSCPLTCDNLAACSACQCSVVDAGGGPWGDAMDVAMCLLPIVFLLGVTLKPNPMPTTRSLPLSAVTMLLIRLAYLASDPQLVCAAVISGLHEALSPLTIMFGAIMLFETMEATLCMPYMMREMKALTKGHAVAELMILFNFAYMVEGASGFGTPVALGAPMLASLGYPKFEAVATLLLMNTFATVWGAVGTPIWFGFGNLDLSDEEFIEISFKAGTALSIAALLLLPSMVLTIACPFSVLKQNALFILLSMASSTCSALGLSFVSFEFPALLGGMLGCGITALLISFRVGLKPYEGHDDRHPLAIDTTSDNHSIISTYRKDKEEEIASKVNGVTSHTLDGSLAPLPEEVSAQLGSKYQSQTSSISVVSIGTGVAPTEENADDEDEEQPAVENDHKTNGDDEQDEEMPIGDMAADDEPRDEILSSDVAIEMYLGPRKSFGAAYAMELAGRTFPIWGTVLLLVLTRVPSIGLKGLLTKLEPNFAIHLGTYGTFRMSVSLVLQLQNILSYPNLNWKYELLYIPFIVPFMLTSILTMVIFRNSLQSKPTAIIETVAGRLKNPAVALMGALVLVQLMIKAGPASPASIIGTTLSKAFQGGWIAVAAFIGALGSFFSGSTTISNLTFGEIHQIAARELGTSPTALLALQAAGASAGNGICLNNIIAACAVVGLNVGEGKIIAKTGLRVFLFCVIATVVMLAFFLRFP